MPEVKNAAWARNDIDRLLLAKLEPKNIAPAAEADRVTLIRRLYFDLTGLPPTPAEIDEFLQDNRPDAYERVVDKLLASPAYGERMASWWFDLIRFSDTVGYHGDQDHRIAPYPRLRHQIVQRQPAVRPVHDRATGRRPAAESHDVAAGGHRLQPHSANHARRRRAGRRISGQAPGRPRAEFLGSLAGGLDGLRRMPRSQVRPVHAERFLQPGSVLCGCGSFTDRSKRSRATPCRPSVRPKCSPGRCPCTKKSASSTRKSPSWKPSWADLFKGNWEKRRDELIKLKKQRLELERKFVPTMITKATTPRDMRILPRGNWMDQSGEVVQPQVPHFFEPLASAAAAPRGSTWPGGLSTARIRSRRASS